jgi:hypothetical protein
MREPAIVGWPRFRFQDEADGSFARLFVARLEDVERGGK